jgi:hypothetical protein
MAEFVIPRNQDGTGWVRISLHETAAARLLIPQLSAQVKYRKKVQHERMTEEMCGRRAKRSLAYRVKLQADPAVDAYMTPRFSLDFGHPRSTLLVLADWWTTNEINWVRIQDITNSKWHLHRSKFHATSLAA